MKVIFTVISIFSAVASTISAQNLPLVHASVKKDLSGAISRLNELREKIEMEKIPLSSEIRKLQREAREKRVEVDRLNRLRDNRDANLIQLKEEVKEGETELDSIARVLKSYTRSWSENIPPAEWIPLQKMAGKFSRSSTDATRNEIIKWHFNVTNISANFIQKQAGGIKFLGNAIVPPEGRREDGLFWAIGPILFFAGNDGRSGLVEKHSLDTNVLGVDFIGGVSLSEKPSRIIPTSEQTSNLIYQTLTDKVGNLNSLPLDPTLGKASVLEIGEPTILEELQKGGIWIYPILFFALLSTLIAIFKANQILSIPLPKGPVTLAGDFSGPFERLRKTAQGYRGNKPEILEEILYEIIIDFQERLEKGLPLVAITAAIAPLLGLLGTVTGMIDVFRQITNFANPENSELARGISEALVTTKFGLVTAIPALVIHALLTRRLQGMISKMEGVSSRLVHLKKENPATLQKEKKNEDAE